MTSKEMQLKGAKNRWANMTPEQRSKVMSRVRAGEKAKLKVAPKRVL